MRRRFCRTGRTNLLYTLVLAAVAVLAVLAFLLYGLSRRDRGEAVDELFFYCASGLQPAVEKIAEEYEAEYGVRIDLQHGGSASLLSQIKVARTGDLYLAGDDTYTLKAVEAGLVAEQIPVAVMHPVLVVRKGNPKGIQGIDDLLRDDVRVALGNPGQAAIGKATRDLLTESGHWTALEKHVTDKGVFKPTVPDVASDVTIGSVDAGIVWDATASQYPDLEVVSAAELDGGEGRVTIGVLKSAKNPTAALRFARYLAARDRGLGAFEDLGYEPVDGDVWAEVPEVTFFAGSVNRRALEPIIQEFERREGVTVNTVYNGCGILTGQMRTIRQNQESGFPDMYMACDVYYLDTVSDWFQDAVKVSNTDIVIAVQEGNPENIHSLADLARPGIRLAVGQPDQCTIGVLTRRLLEAEGLYEKLLEDNVVTQAPSSAMLVPSVATKSVDAALAYATDTRAEEDKVDVVLIDSALAKAVQPYAIARSSDHKYVARRLFTKIADSRKAFESAGFNWGLDSAAQGEEGPEGPDRAGKEEESETEP